MIPSIFLIWVAFNYVLSYNNYKQDLLAFTCTRKDIGIVMFIDTSIYTLLFIGSVWELTKD